MTPYVPTEARYRPPYLKAYRSFDAPLTVLCTLLSRADNAPLSERRRDPNLLLDDKGELIGDPRETRVGFEANPNYAFEKWTEYWRKVHGPRFIAAQPPELNAIAQLLRYEQMHRLPAGPSSSRPLPYEPPLDERGELYDRVVGHIPPYQRPQWDGIAYLNFENREGLQAVFAQPEIASKILPEDQMIFRELCPVLAEQHIVIPSQTQRDPVLLVKVFKRRPRLTREEFLDRWLSEHAHVVLDQPVTSRYVQRYVQLHNVGPTDATEAFYHPIGSTLDGVSLMAFSSVNDLEDFLLDRDAARIATSEAEFVDLEASEHWTAITYQVVNQIFPETSTLD